MSVSQDHWSSGFIVQLSLYLGTKILCISGAPNEKLSWGCKVGQISSRGITIHDHLVRFTFLIQNPFESIDLKRDS